MTNNTSVSACTLKTYQRRSRVQIAILWDVLSGRSDSGLPHTQITIISVLCFKK